MSKFLFYIYIYICDAEIISYVSYCTSTNELFLPTSLYVKINNLHHHRFGSMYFDHSHASQWPGFSLLPAIWDLNVLSANTDLIFDENDPSSSGFETAFSLQVLDAGLVTAHLPAVNYRYFGSQN